MPIDEKDIERLREIFVARKTCEAQCRDFAGKLGNDNTRLAVIESQLKLITWLLMAVGGGIITMLVKMFFGG